tara:strand:+ start:1634 stop:1756 length:123 start_codon:yes stop_codon:yes gene_type:complete
MIIEKIFTVASSRLTAKENVKVRGKNRQLSTHFMKGICYA